MYGLLYLCLSILKLPALGASIPSRSATAAQHVPTVGEKSNAAPVIVLRMHIGAVREQFLHDRRMPGGSGPMERLPPAVECARGSKSGCA